MKNTLHPLACLVAALLVTLTACVKEPKPGHPHPPKPGWLLTKVVASETRGEPEGGPVYNSLTIDEYRYNKDAKPWLHRQYYGVDSNHLELRLADTIFYDKKLRPIRKGVYNNASSIQFQYRFAYSGDNPYPTSLEEYLVEAGGGLTLLDTRKYVYRDTIVSLIFSHGDTITYVYNKQNNYIGIYDPFIGQITSYDTYDNNINASRYLNLNFSWVLNIPEADQGPLYSRNNWTHNAVDFLSRDITYDAEGKVIRSAVQYQFPTRNVISEYYYTKPD
ncbi:MAG TPA: hypothetical protein VGE90_06240 [Chitinophaga sp.]